MSRLRIIETCDKCGVEFDYLTEGQYINQKIPRCFNCQPRGIYIKRNTEKPEAIYSLKRY